MRPVSRRSVIAGLGAMGTGVLLHEPVAAAGYVNKRVTGPGYCTSGVRWLASSFGDTLKACVSGTPFSAALLFAIAYQESGYFWWRPSHFGRKTKPESILRLIVLDDVEPRGEGIFPRDSQTFLADPRYAQIAPVLAAASDAARVEQSQAKTGKVRFGYGIFQNDLQNIEKHPEFWTTSLPASPQVVGMGAILRHAQNIASKSLPVSMT